MARTVCPKCGHVNKGSSSICSKCGYYMLPDQIASQYQSQTASSISLQKDTGSPPAAGMEGPALEVKDRGGTIGRVIYGAVYLVLFGLLIMVYVYNLNIYFVFPFLIIVFALSPVLRRLFSGIKYYQSGFTILTEGGNEQFAYETIDTGQTWRGLRGHQFLQLAMKNSSRPVTMEFFSPSTFRSLYLQMRKRGISITVREMAAEQNRNRMM